MRTICFRTKLRLPAATPDWATRAAWVIPELSSMASRSRRSSLAGFQNSISESTIALSGCQAHKSQCPGRSHLIFEREITCNRLKRCIRRALGASARQIVTQQPANSIPFRWISASSMSCGAVSLAFRCNRPKPVSMSSARHLLRLLPMRVLLGSRVRRAVEG